MSDILCQVVQKNQPSFHCENVKNLIIGSNEIALEAALRYAQSLGYVSFVLSHTIVGDATERGQMFAQLADFICRSLSAGRMADPSLVEAELDIVQCGVDKTTINRLRWLLEESGHTGRPVCVLAAGETTVNVSGGGVGGRNQQMALAAAIGMDNLMRDDVAHEFAVEFLSSGTDGQDGPTDAAGALADPEMVRRSAKSSLLDAETFLRDNDSYGFFSRVDKGRNHVKTGLTGTNVMDLQVLLISKCRLDSAVPL